jgi:hypothetical protein
VKRAVDGYVLVDLRTLNKWEGPQRLFGRDDDDIFRDVLTEVERDLG